MLSINGVNLLPATGEFTYDTQAYLGQRVSEPGLTSINRYASGGTGSVTDYSIALDQLQAQFPDCTTVAVVVAWFGSSTDVTACQIYPATTYSGGAFQKVGGGSDVWRCSSLTQNSSGLIALPMSGESFVYGGTPSDQSIVRCLQDLKTRGLRTVFYPFLLMTATGFPWRGRITYTGSDISSAATAAVTTFLGSATTSEFTRDATNLTVTYAGSATDYTYRRMILHYANLCVLAGGVDLFLLGSELRGLETIRGPAWTKAGTTGGDGNVTWDYPFVAGLMQLADDVRSVFDGASLTKDLSGLHNLISYSADWSDWMGFQHPGENGQWPHLDQLWGHANIDLVAFDNYLPLSDWTTSADQLDIVNWASPAPSLELVDYGLASTSATLMDFGLASDPAVQPEDYGLASQSLSWPPSSSTMNGLGLSGQPTITSLAYLKANIEGGEKFNWYYADGNNDGIGFDPSGSDLRVSLPEGDRLAQNRQPYYAGQQLLANKQLRWWWNNAHQAIYDNGDGTGWSPHGPFTEWVAQTKPIIFAEYGVPACDRGTNQPNVFYDPKSTESFTPYWSVWDPASGGVYLPRPDDEIQLLALQAIHDYWFVDGNNAMSPAGVKLIEPSFCCVWNWDARPFPAFPMLTEVWGDAGNWRAGQWLSGKGPYLTPLVADSAPTPGPIPAFPTLSGQGWSVHYRPSFAGAAASHVSGRESRVAKTSLPLWEIELAFDVLRMNEGFEDLQAILGFYGDMQGQAGIFTFPLPAELGQGDKLDCRFDDDTQDLEAFMTELFTLKSLKLRSVK